MKKLLAIFICVTILIVGCKKYNENPDHLSGDLYYRGRAFVANELTVMEAKPLPLKEVKIGYLKDSMKNYLISTRTDSNGYFLFEHLNEKQDYIIFGEFEENGVKYSAQVNTKLIASIDASELIFKVSSKQNGVIYTVKDKHNGYVPSTTVCFFTSFVAANDTCKGSTYQVTTDSYGRAYKTGMVPGDYVVVFRAEFGNLILKATDTIRGLPTEGFLTKEITVE